MSSASGGFVSLILTRGSAPKPRRVSAPDLYYRLALPRSPWCLLAPHPLYAHVQGSTINQAMRAIGNEQNMSAAAGIDQNKNKCRWNTSQSTAAMRLGLTKKKDKNLAIA